MAAIVLNKTAFLNAPITVESLHGVTFSNESKGHKFVISCMQDGELINLTGSVSARFMRANGTTILLASGEYGDIVDGKAVVTLHQDCYNVPGRFQLAIFNTVGQQTTCIYACVGTVQRTQTETIIDSGEVIPDISELLAQIEACEDATDAANTAADVANAAAVAGDNKFVRYDAAQALTDAQKNTARTNTNSALADSVAPLFDATQAYNAGTYVRYTDGNLYKITAWHTANVTWANTQKTLVNVGSALVQTLNDAGSVAQLFAEGTRAYIAPNFSNAAAYSAGDYVIYNAQMWRFNTDHAAGDWNASEVTAVVVGSEVSDLKSAFNGICDVVRLDRITPAQTVNGYIRTNGNYYQSDVYNIIKYKVVAGTTIYISADKVNEAVYQFQDSNSIPNSGNTHIIGETVQESTNGYVTVPTGATWLLISDVANGKNGIYDPNTDKVFEFVDNFTIEGSIPGEFNSLVEKCAVTLDELSSKKVFVSNKNLLPQFPAITDHGVTCAQNADGSITLSGTSNGVASFQISGNVMPNVGPGTYTLSARNPSAIGDNLTYINPAINGSYSSVGCRLNTVDAETTFVLSEGQYISSIRIRIAANVTLPSNYTLYPQLEVGGTKTDFVAHKDFIATPTANPTEISCFAGYNYICVQGGVSGNVSYYFNAPKTLADLGSRVTALENKPSASKKFSGKKIVCFGDSITGNFQAPTDYPSMIADLTGATVYNAGFGGCCMCDNGQTRRLFTMCRLVDSIVAGDFSAQRNSGVSITYAGTSINYVPERLDTLESIDWSEIDYITIAYGTNDWNSNYGLDNENNMLDTTTYVGAFRYSVEKLLAAYPNIKIMVITPLWRWWDTNTGMPSEIHSDYIDSNDYAKGTGYKLWQYGDALVSAAKLYHVPVFDLYWNCMMNKQNRFQYFNTTDGTHPKQEGRELMAELISAHLESVY